MDRLDHDDAGRSFMSVLVRFDVERGFVNAQVGPVELITGSGGGDCGYSFVVGERYLVYASRTASSRLTTSICSRTRPVKQAREDLRYLATISAPASGARVYGRITHWRRDPFEAQMVDYGPVEGVVVTLRGGTFVRDATTNKDGRFEFSGLVPGRLTLTPTAPPGFDQRYLQREIEIKDARACSEHDFQFIQIAEAVGRVVDAAGRPLSGISIDAVAAELAGHRPPPYQRPVTTNDNGVFAFDELPPGKYVFGVNLTQGLGVKPSGQPLFLPGTAVADEATIIELHAGDRSDVGVLRLTGR